MTHYQQSVENAQNWKSVVSKLWKRQLIILLLTLAIVTLLICDNKIGSNQFAILLAGLGIAIYVVQWIVFATLNKWRKIAPESLKESINLVAIGLMVMLIGSTISFVVPIGVFATLVGGIVQFMGIVQLRKANEMPKVARKGASSIMWGIIISWITGFAVVLVFIVGLMELDELSSGTFGEDNNDIATVLSAIGITIKFTKFMYIIAVMLMIAVIGGAISAFLTYRGWWLIGKSELPVLPEPTEELDYEGVASTNEQNE